MKDINVNDLGKKVKEMRVALNLTQKQLSQIIGVAPNTVTQYENGTARPSYEVLVKIAIALGVTSDYLLGLED